MSFIRARALRSVQFTLTSAAPRFATPRTQLVARRYASSGHGAHTPSSDMPWLISALVVTPVSCWYLWPSSSHADAGHHGEHEEHAEHEEAHEDEKSEEPESAPKDDEKSAEPKEEAPEEKSEEKSEDKPAEDAKPEDSDGSGDASDSEPKQEGSQEKTATSGVNFKGKMHSESDGHNHTKKIEPGNKGGDKIRLDSGLGKNLGEGHSSNTAYNESEGADGSGSTIGKKQAGLSNTDTRHSTRPDEEGSGISTKGSGGPETAKSKNTIDHKAPVK